MYDDWTKCTECQFFDPEKYYCKKLLHTVTTGCPYGEPKQETHYDAIVHMTLEELAAFFAQQEYRKPVFDGWLPLCNHVMGPRTCNENGCEKCWLDFLKEAVDHES